MTDRIGQRGGAPGHKPDRHPRRWTQESFIPFRLEILTPVFIGTGTDLSPLEYVIRKEAGAYVLHLVDSQSWLLASQDKPDISAALKAGKMSGLRRLMDEHLDAGLYSLARIPVSSSALAQSLLKSIHDPGSLSKAEVQPFPRSPVSMAPYVPGSSLKGSLSTPLIDSLDQGGHLCNARAGYQSEMSRLLGSIEHHAMQALKVADVPVPPGATIIVAASEVRMAPGKPGTPKTPCEALLPGAGYLPLYGRLLVDSTGGKPAITLPSGQQISLAKLGEICKSFYYRRFAGELDKFYRQPHLAFVGRALQPVLRRIDSLDPKQEILLRVGHYSHVECVTVTANAPQGRKGFGKTRTLANRELPFGWVLLSFCSMAEYEAGSSALAAAIEAAASERETRRAEREAQILRVTEEHARLAMAAEEVRSRAAEVQRQKEREAAEREARLAALSPAERKIAELAGPEATKEQSMQLYSLLKNMADEERLGAARALRECWQRLGEWGGKQLSKKQAQKVAELKAILGE